MGWIIFAVCVIGFLIYFFVEEWTGGIDIGGFIASLLLGLFCGLVGTMLVCGLGGLIAGECADSMVIETNTYELAPSHTNDNIYVVLDGSTYDYLVKSETGQLESDVISVTYSDVQFSDTNTPILTVHTYDFASPVLRFIFWNIFNDYYIFTVPTNGVWLGPTID